MRKFKSFFIFLVLSIGLSSLSFSGDDFEGRDYHYWKKRLIESRDSKNVVLLEMLGEAARESVGFTFQILQIQGPSLFYDDNPDNKRDFQRLLLNLFKTNDLSTLKSFYGIKEGESDLHVARVFQSIFYLYAAVDTGFSYRLRENLKETLSWGWSDPGSPELISQIVESMDEFLGPKISYHIRARVKEIKSLSSIEELAVIVEWELVEVESSYNPQNDDLEATENVVEKRVVREFLAKAEADKIEGDYGTKKGLSVDRAAAIVLFQSLSKTTRIFENPSPREIGNTNWERLMPLLPGGMSFMPIPAGTFDMGSPRDESGRDNDEVLHRVTLTKSFEMMTTEVTQKQWEEVMGSNPSHFKGENLPVENVSWNDAKAFADKMNERNDGWTYRLPTEAEWEYAARAGTETPFYFGHTITTHQANYNGNYPYNQSEKGIYREKTVPVGSLGHANAWGLFDVHGNVWEWVFDWNGAYSTGAVTDPTGPATGSGRVVRGGSWDDGAQVCRSADRGNGGPDVRYSGVGFRLARVRQGSAR